MTPRLKSLTCVVRGDTLLAQFDPRTRVELHDPDGQVRALLELLREGTRDSAGIWAELVTRWPAVTGDEVDAAVEALDNLGWLEDADAGSQLNAYQKARYASNLAFFDAFSSLERTSEQLQTALFESHVLVLGAGGLGSSVLQNLAGLGIGHVTVVDFDTIELKNLARQFTYTEAQVGFPKVQCAAAWISAFNSDIDITVVDREITAPGMIPPLLDGVAVVVAAIDHPLEIDLWINEACVAAGIPFIRGGLSFTQALYWSVDPGHSACRQCLETHRAREGDGAEALPSVLTAVPVNRGIGPVAGVLGALIAMEAVRYLTRMSPPVAAGNYQLVHLAGDGGVSRDAWPADPCCAICATAPSLDRRRRPDMISSAG